jgi:hypothetical protein
MYLKRHKSNAIYNAFLSSFTYASTHMQGLTNTIASFPTFMIRDPAAPHHLVSTHTQVGSLRHSDPASSSADLDVYPLCRLDSCSLGRIGDSTRFLSGE